MEMSNSVGPEGEFPYTDPLYPQVQTHLPVPETKFMNNINPHQLGKTNKDYISLNRALYLQNSELVIKTTCSLGNNLIN